MGSSVLVGQIPGLARDTQWDSSPQGEGIVLVGIVHLLGQIMDCLQVKWLSWFNGVLVRAHQDVAYFT